MAVAKATVTNDPLSGLLALLEIATGLAGRHGVCVCMIYLGVLRLSEGNGRSLRCFEVTGVTGSGGSLDQDKRRDSEVVERGWQM